MGSNNQHGAADASNPPVLPSFTQSRTYTYESEDGWTNGDHSSLADSSLASESMASQSTTNTANMSSPGGANTSISKSARYKNAMTTRARQRRMRRMREREGGEASSTPGSTSVTSLSNNNGSSSSNGLPPTTTTATSAIPNAPDSPRVKQAKEHVEQMKLHMEQMRKHRSQTQQHLSGIALTQAPPQLPQAVTPNTPANLSQLSNGSTSSSPITPLQSRLYERSRSRSLSRGKDASPTTAADINYNVSNGREQQQHKRSPSSPDLMSGGYAPSGTYSSGSNGGGIIPSSQRGSPLKGTGHSRSSSRDYGIPKAVTPQRSNTNAATASSARRSSKKESREYNRPKPEEFLPDWKANSPAAGNFTGTRGQKTGQVFDGTIDPEEIRNAANYTSIQFQCSNLSGEVEMLSGEEHSVLGGDDVCGVGGSSTGRNTPSSNMWGNEVYGSQQYQQNQHNQGGSGGEGANRESSGGKHTWQNEVWSDATTPSILQRNEIFHQKAAASIVSLLSPDRMLGAGLMAPEIDRDNPNYGEDNEDNDAKDVDGDSPTGVIPGVNGSMKNMLTFDGDKDPGSSRGGEWCGMTQVNRTLFRDDLDEDVKQSMIFQAFRQNMVKPSVQLSDLLSQIHRKSGGENEVIDRAFATRRKNACGALKILSAKEENRMKICWTVGVLPAIASVLSDVNLVIPDELSRAANTEARNRIVSTLLNLSVNKKNRMLIVNTPGVLESMVTCIQYDPGESRQGCCTVLLYLAKTAETRSMIAKSAGMMETLAKIIEVPKEALKKDNKTGKKSRVLAREPVSPLSPGETTLDDTVDTGRSSFMDDDHSHSDGSDSRGSSHSGSHSSRGSSKSSGDNASNKDDKSVGSKIPLGDVEQMEISFETEATPEISNSSSRGGGAAAAGGKEKEEVKDDMYDADPNRFLHGARLSIFACLLCLVKSKENAFTIAREAVIVEALIGVSKRHASPSHSRAMAILAHLTRHPKNCHQLVYKYASLLPMLQNVTGSPDKEARRYAFCALQNLSMDKSCRAPIAHSPKIIWSLTKCCKDTKSPANDEDEARMAAVATLQNLSDEPANLIQFTIVKDCIGNIIQIAREDLSMNEKTDLTAFMAKNTLVTLSHWFRKIATSGSERMVAGGGRTIGDTKGSMMSGFPPGGGVSPGSGVSPGGATRSQARLYSARLEPTMFNQWS